MLRVGHGDRRAFSELYDRTAAQVLSAVSGIIPESSAAEDVVREVYLAVWQSAPRRERYRGWVAQWMFVMAHRYALDHVRCAVR